MYQEQTEIFYVINKIDLSSSSDSIEKYLNADTNNNNEYHTISCKTNKGIDALLQKISTKTQSITTATTASSTSTNIITRTRHRYHLVCADNALQHFLNVSSKNGLYGIDLASEDLRLACSEIGRIVGVIDVEDVLDVLFQDFCIGK